MTTGATVRMSSSCSHEWTIISDAFRDDQWLQAFQGADINFHRRLDRATGVRRIDRGREDFLEG